MLRAPDADLRALGYIDDFFMAIPTLNRMTPRNDLKYGDTKWVLAEPGANYVAYSYSATANLGVKGLTNGSYQLKWLDTVDGSTVVQTVSVTSANRTFPRPASIQPESALYIRKL